MQIARIVPKTRTQKESVFDYAIPPELLPLIQPGILVEVPFHGRKIEGIVIDLKRSSKILRLKSIIKIIDPIPVIDENHLQLAKWMTDYYLEPLGKTLFENIIPPAIRIIKKTPEQYRRDDIKHTVINNPKKFLVIGSFSKRINIYLKAINQTLKRNKQVIIIVPDLTNIEYFSHYIKKPMTILHGGLTLSERYTKWQKIRSDSIPIIIIGSNSAIFAPANNLGLIIIDQEESETYKNDRSPRFHVASVAEKLCDISKFHLILGTVAPRVETYYKAKQENYIIKNISDTKKPNITITNMNSEKSIISSNLENGINGSLRKKEKILLLLNRKGEGTKLACADCGFVMLCPKCQLPLIPQNDNTICFHCEKQFPIITNCPKCQSVNLKVVGLGTKKLEKIINKRWPNIKTIRLEANNVAIDNNWNIAIATSYALKLKLPDIHLVAIIDADQSLNMPDYKANEKTFMTFYKFLKVGEQGIVQTHLPQNPTISALAGLNYNKFYQEEIKYRHQFSFPPFERLTRLLYKNSDEKICQKKAERVYQRLKNLSNFSILGPSPAFIFKKLGKFRYQIIIKIPKGLTMPENLRVYLRSLRDWVVDVEPMDLL